MRTSGSRRKGGGGGGGGGGGAGRQPTMSLLGLNWRFLRESLGEEEELPPPHVSPRSGPSSPLDTASWQSLQHYVAGPEAPEPIIESFPDITKASAAAAAIASRGTLSSGTLRHSQSVERKLDQTDSGAPGSGGSPVATSADLQKMLPPRSISPMIVWRSSAKVSLAEHVPAELLGLDRAQAAAAARDGNVDPTLRSLRLPPPQSRRSHTRRSGTAAAGPSSSPVRLPTKPQTNHGRRGNLMFAESRQSTVLPQSPKFKPSPPKSTATKAYGAWYIPPEMWQPRDQSNSCMKVLKPHDEDVQALDAKLAHNRKEIASLPIGKQLKAFISSRGDRVPHFLQDVED